MMFKMSEFQGIDPNHVTKLREAGIETTEDFMKLWGDKTKRQGLMEKTGITGEQFAGYGSKVRLARIKGVGLGNVELLIAAGIDGPKSLFEYTPEALVKRLGETAAEKKVPGTVPTLDQVTLWFTERKPATAVAP